MENEYIKKSSKEIIDYIKEKIEVDGFLSYSIHDRIGFLSELESISHDIDKASKRLINLSNHFAFDRMRAFSEFETRICAAHEKVSSAWSEIECAKIELRVKHAQNTRSMDLQRSVVRLASAYFDHLGRGVARREALRIIEKMGLDVPEQSTLSRWLKEDRQ